MKCSNCFILVVGAVSMLAMVDRAGAQPTNTFLPTTGYWHIGENWSLGHEPQSTEEAFIPSGRTCTIIQDNGTGAPSFALREGWGTDAPFSPSPLLRKEGEPNRVGIYAQAGADPPEGFEVVDVMQVEDQIGWPALNNCGEIVFSVGVLGFV